MSTQFNCQKHFYFKLFSLFKQLYITIQFSVCTVSMSKTVEFQTIQFSISTKFKYKYSLIVKNISISSYSVYAVLIQLIQFSISIDFVYTQSGHGSDGNKGVLRISQSSSIAGTSPLDCLVSHAGHSLEGGGLTPLQRSSWCILQPRCLVALYHTTRSGFELSSPLQFSEPTTIMSPSTLQHTNKTITAMFNAIWFLRVYVCVCVWRR